MPGSRTAGNSFVIVARPSTVRPRTGRSATTSARAASMSATASASKCVRRDAPIRIGWATSSHATSSPRPPARRAAQNCATSELTSMIAPNQNADGMASIGSAASGRVLEPEVAEGQRPGAHEVRVAGVHEEVVHPDVGERRPSSSARPTAPRARRTARPCGARVRRLALAAQQRDEDERRDPGDVEEEPVGQPRAARARSTAAASAATPMRSLRRGHERDRDPKTDRRDLHERVRPVQPASQPVDGERRPAVGLVAQRRVPEVLQRAPEEEDRSDTTATAEDERDDEPAGATRAPGEQREERRAGANFVIPASAMRIPRPIGFPHASTAPSTRATGSASLAFVFATKSENGNAGHA